MRTSPKISVRQGEVHVIHGANGGVISTIIVTDTRATDRYGCLEGGAECRDATTAEIRAAEAAGSVRHVTY